MVMGWLGILGCFALARQLGAGSAAALLAAAIVGFNPLSLPLSLTYMTDPAFGLTADTQQEIQLELLEQFKAEEIEFARRPLVAAAA